MSDREIVLMLPNLEILVNRLAEVRHGMCYQRDLVDPDRMFAPRQASDIDEEMAAHVLSMRNKLKWVNACHKIRVNCFEIAAAAMALRIAKKENTDQAADCTALAARIENARRRAKGATTRHIGKSNYAQSAEQWRGFLRWAQLNLVPSHSRKRPSLDYAFHKEQREQMRKLVYDIFQNDAVVELEANHLVCLAKRELHRGRHESTPREMLNDPERARQFLIQFAIKRDYARKLKPEFQPVCLKSASLGKKFAEALPRIGQSPSGLDPLALSSVTDVIAKNSGNPSVYSVAVPLPKEVPVDYSSKSQSRISLSMAFASWLMSEVDPGYWRDVVQEIQFHILQAPKKPRKTIDGLPLRQIIEQARPELLLGNGFDDVLNFWIEWSLDWMFAVEPNFARVSSAVSAGFSEAQVRWREFSELTRRRKLSEIHRRYFQRRVGGVSIESFHS